MVLSERRPLVKPDFGQAPALRRETISGEGAPELNAIPAGRQPDRGTARPNEADQHHCGGADRPVGGLILAAGESTRFGAPKQLATLDGRPLIEHALAAALASPSINRVVVVLGAQADRIRREANLVGAATVVARDWAEGIAASLRTGIEALGDVDVAVVLLADQPGVTPAAIEGVIAAVRGGHPAARATFGGEPGHPVAISRAWFDALASLRGDRGAGELLNRRGAVTLECAELADGRDIDTRADLDALVEGDSPSR